MQFTSALVIAMSIACTHPAGLTPGSELDPVPEVPRCGDLATRIAARVDALRAQHDYPGVIAGVVVGDHLALVVPRGMADRNSERALDANTVFQIGSVTKMLVGLLAASLSADGTIDLNTPLARYFGDDEIPADAAQVTLHQLATHTAGFPRYPHNLNRDDGDPILDYDRGQLLEAIASVQLEFPPGTEWSYSNFGYGVLAEALRRATGSELRVLLERRILTPLGLNDTTLELDSRIGERLATPYRDDDPTVATEPWRMGALSAAGNAFSTMSDLARLASVEMDPGRNARKLATAFAKAQTVAWSFARDDRINGYGLGRLVIDSQEIGARVVWHGGDVDGYVSALMVAPERGVAVIVLANSGMGKPIGKFLNWLMAEAIRRCDVPDPFAHLLRGDRLQRGRMSHGDERRDDHDGRRDGQG